MVTEPFLHQASIMATNTSSFTTNTPSAFALPVTEKPTKSNYLLWHAQIMAAIHAAKLQGLLDGSDKQPSPRKLMTLSSMSQIRPMVNG
jgi:hypothetical protein